MDWGLGHVSRTIPIIKNLLKRGHTVITCGNQNIKTIYKEEFKSLKHIDFKGYNPKYSKGNNQGLVMIKQSSKFFNLIKEEGKFADKIASEMNLDYIISDNRFGFRSKHTTNIFICHQINIQGPLLLKIMMRKINYGFIKKFDQCWIPDLNGKEKLSGKLSINKFKNCHYIGTLSRFNKVCKPKEKWTYKYLAILSGPEPQRSILEKKIIQAFNELDAQCAIIQGVPSNEKLRLNKIDFFPHLKTMDFFNIIDNSETIICRSGYSSIMDLSTLQKQVILIPTPGQTEQEYLSKYHQIKSNVTTVKQSAFSLDKIKKPTPIKQTTNDSQLMINVFKSCGL